MQQNRRSKNNFPSKRLVDSIKSTIFAPTRTRQASPRCSNVRVVLFQKQQNRRSKNNFPSKSLVDSIKSTIFAPTRTRQASLQCLNRRVVLFLYGTLPTCFYDALHSSPSNTYTATGYATVAPSPNAPRVRT